MTSPDLLVEIQSALRKDFDTDVVPSDQQIIQWVQYACQQQIHAFSELLTHQPLGDVVICHDVVASEAEQQGKNILDHYAHMVTHGILHLCGFDHLEEQAANRMEALEASVLALSHIANPYQ